MKKLKAIISIVLCLLLTMGLTVNSFAASTTGISLSLDKSSAEAGNLPSTVKMTVSTKSSIVPVSFSGEAYSSDSKITISKIDDGDKELTSNVSEGRFAWMNGSNSKSVDELAVITFAIPSDLPAGTYTLGVRNMSAQDSTEAALLSASSATTTFTVTGSSPVSTTGISLSLDKSSAEAGNLPSTVKMTVSTKSSIVPVSFSGEAYSSDSKITISKIDDGDKELSTNVSEGRFAWMNGSNTKSVSELAVITFAIPSNLPAGTYTLGVRNMSAQDSTEAALLSASSATTTFTVTGGSSSVSVTGVSLNKSSLTLAVGGSETLTATVAPSNATNKNVTWSTSDKSVVKVSDGRLTAVAPGTAKVKVTTVDGSKTASCEVTVVAKSQDDIDVTSVTLDTQAATLKVGETLTIKATIEPANATIKDVEWSTSDSKVATVKDGIITAAGEGQATITVTTVNGAKTATCNVTVVSEQKDEKCAHEHTYLEGEKEATCESKGYTGDTYCKDCGELIAAGKDIDILAHEYIDGVCKNCGAPDPNYVEPKESSPWSWIIPVGVGVIALAGGAFYYMKKKTATGENEGDGNQEDDIQEN